MCGISAIISYSNEDVIKSLLESLYYIQHRGQDSFGIVGIQHSQRIMLCNSLKSYKRHGLIKTEDLMNYDSSRIGNSKKLLLPTGNDYEDLPKGNVGIGHVRYPTTGGKDINSIQPFIKRPTLKQQYSNRQYIMAHNGQVRIRPGFERVLEELNVSKNISTDSELILNILMIELDYQKILTDEIIRTAVRKLGEYLIGSYSIILYITDVGLITFRDINGIKPLSIGKKDDNYIINSETVGIKGADYEYMCSVDPGEVVIFYNNQYSRDVVRVKYKENCELRPCIFEWIYMANVSSVIEGVSVYDARLKMGEYLANKIKQTLINVGYDIADIDYVVPVPETSKPSAIMVAEKLGITYRELLIKNRYVNRTFIMDSQNKRKHNIKHKFLLIDHLIRDKNIILVDDSIVRGNTLKHVVSQLRNAGARNIIVASCSAPIRYINRYGIDIQDPELLIARSKNEDEIAGELGANAVIYQSIYDMKRSIMDLNPKIKNFEMSVFEGDK